MMIMNILKTGIFISVALPSSVMFLVLMECRAQLTSSKLICKNLRLYVTILHIWLFRYMEFQCY